MQLEADTAPAMEADNSPLTIDQAVDLQLKQRELPLENEDQTEEAEALQPEEEAGSVEEPVETADEESEADAQSADDGDEAPEEDTLEAEQEQETAPETGTREPPARWDAKGRDLFAKLPADTQDYILAREKDRQAEITKAQMKSADVTKTLETRIQHLTSVSEAIDGYVENGEKELEQWDEVMDKWDAFFASDEALAMARDNEAEYRRNEALHRQHKAAQATARRNLDKAKKDKVTADKAALESFVAEQRRLLPEHAPDLADPEKGSERMRDTVKYLAEQSFDPDRITWISSREAAIAYKAMRFDALGDVDALVRDAELYRKADAQTRRTPPKPKVNAGPNAPAAGQGQAPSSTEARFKKLNSKQSLSAEEHGELMLLKRQLGK